MGANGTVTMTELKTATGIADDRLSAHNPGGTGNPTKMSDFLIDAIGNRQENLGPADYQRSIPVVGAPGPMFPGVANDVQSFRVQVSQANIANPGTQGGNGGQYFFDAIMKDRLSMDSGSFQGWDVIKNDPSTDDFLNFEITAKATDTNGIVGDITFDSSLNSDATNADGIGVNFSYTNVEDQPGMARFTWSGGDGSATATYYDPDGNASIDYFEFQMSSSITSPSGTVQVPSTYSGGNLTLSFSWDPTQQSISGDNNAQVSAYDANNNLVTNGSLSGPSGTNGSIIWSGT